MSEGKRIFDGVESEAARVQLRMVDSNERTVESLATNPDDFPYIGEMRRISIGRERGAAGA